MGAAVAGAGVAEVETVAEKLADAGTFDTEASEMAATELLEETPLDALEVPGIAAPAGAEAVDPGVVNELSPELDNVGVPLIGPEVLVPRDAV